MKDLKPLWLINVLKSSSANSCVNDECKITVSEFSVSISRVNDVIFNTNSTLTWLIIQAVLGH
jgi:phosphoserine aminotransferase